jgi:hypothetical protein
VFDPNMNLVRLDASVKQLLNQVRQDAGQRGKGGAGRGWGAGEALEFVEALERPATVPWQSYLRRLEGRLTGGEYEPTKARPSRRDPSHWGRVLEGSGKVAVGVDTSASMSADILALLDAELRGIFLRLGSEPGCIKILHCDTKVAKSEDYSPTRPLQSFSGRGGTDFSDMFFWMRKNGMPDFFVCYTDGHGGVEDYADQIAEERSAEWYEHFAESEPRYSPDGTEVLWLIPDDEFSTSPDYFKDHVCPWGTVVTIPSPKKDEE